ncbi:cyclic pyranopterin phosphate synthase [Oceanospirillum multiglobuliferum]|uniref:GTP 3',8-cyclase n=1 Tax=Oceanospirillum multiglobuliferum TaxID=64969 RepID=A0A1T4R5S3_9GAMM|nr:GTP 3',8-cyclase MoaA [Oceanospirillum multiglobuliferum]OPX55215.1 cyclic pyranopterin phosphate synthase MoaA [Oceanospirillum multiglobuliferum]SKA11414.1 cyclic pyranopterin phosphate synthase [Oceanospirillum multiglobuliferum]
MTRVDAPLSHSPHTPLVDRFGRKVSYVRLSVTDRCDFRCVYCMGENMSFLPREQVLTLEEIGLIAQAFAELGTNKIRLTGGEPLVRRDLLQLVQTVGDLPQITDFAMTTNGSQLPTYAKALKAAGLKRLNISLDSLIPERFKQLTRIGDLNKVIKGIEAAIEQGFKGIKLNAVILKGRNDDEVVSLVEFALAKGIDISFIEEMPLGEINEHQRASTFCSSDDVRALIEQRYSLLASTDHTQGPSRYYRIASAHAPCQFSEAQLHQIKIGFISPHSHNFCDSCNRVRVTAEGRLLLCLGNEHSVDLRATLRQYPNQIEPLKQAIIQAMDLKPERHHFSTEGEVQVLRFMNMTGG